MRNLMLFIIGLAILSCKTTASNNLSSVTTKKQSSEPNYEIAIDFINEYLDFSNDPQSKNSLLEWINNRNDLTVEFKNELKRILKEANKNDPELGLGFDPILDAQDNPNIFELDKTDSEFLTVKGKYWTDFKMTLKVKLVNNKWLVDGAGIINIPEYKRIKR